jgi:uncharacterized protein
MAASVAPRAEHDHHRAAGALVGPTSEAERLEVLDALRGFALCGILLANLASFFGYSTYAPEDIVALPAAERGTLFLIDWLIEGKFYAIFSMLFGIGFALQSRRMSRPGEDFARYWLRRMTVLTGIGLLHMFLVWHGDILTLYSVLGLFLLLFRGRSERALMSWALVLFATPLIMHGFIVATQDHPFWSSAAEWAQAQKAHFGFGGRSHLQMRTSDDAMEVLAINALTALQRPMSYLQSGRYTEVFGMFVLGALLGRVWLAAGTVGRWFPWGGWKRLGLAGALLSLGYAVMKGAMGTPYSVDGPGLLQGAFYHLGAITLGLGLIGLFTSSWERVAWRARLQPLAVLGRMALTNYVLQNLLAASLFFGTGLGLMRHLPFTLIPAVALAIIVLQYLFSRAWMSAHSQGPLEYLWRKAAYPRSARR